MPNTNEYMRKWKAANPEKVKAYSKAEYARLKADPVRMAIKKARDNALYYTSEKLRETRKRYRREHKEMFRQIMRDQRKNRPWAVLFNAARERCKKSGLEFTITREWCGEFYTGKCRLTGVPFVYMRGKTSAYSPSLDRIDSSRGYTPDNCRFILWGINRFKGDGDDATVKAIAKAIVDAG